MNNNTTVATKSVIGLVAGVFGYLAGALSEAFVVLAVMVIMDYVLGIAAKIMRGEKFDTLLAVKGACKKALYAFAIVLGLLGDYLIFFMAEGLGLEIPVKALLGVAVALYLIGTEGLSIGRNLILIGIPLPLFLLKFFGLVKDQSGKIISIPKGDADYD